MFQLASERADAAAHCYHGPGIDHDAEISCTRTKVNVECVPLAVDIPYVPENETTGEALSRLRVRAGMTMRELAAAAGYRHASGIQRFLEASYSKPLPNEIAQRFVDALSGRGSPPIEPVEIWSLTGIPVAPNVRPAPPMEGASDQRMRRDVPILGTALGADVIMDGEAIEQTYLNSAEIIGYVRRPVILDGRTDVYSLYVQGSSMAPRHHDGEMIFVEQKRRPSVGEDCVIYMRMPDEYEGERTSAVLVKTLVRKTASYIELEQYTPHITFRLPTERVARMDRVIPWPELVA
ncbi:hypothetical protein LZK98_11770 [Sphingomonas cannabina]|uniref:LexA family transcriptional regulator n=1 Tax=Sphingomonas cannabina TaxID=2899123 RepID=UPI001F3CE727|nr:S24 family peptidase [Sphingomonas cannabina]UIJ43769.1 hypothetical protein LZK98_11770 [Sphingomonas cannabina]